MVSGLGNKASDETVRNLFKKKGYKFLHSRKKGLLKPKDLKERLKFPRKIKGIFKKNIWTKGILFYLDGVGYQHKYNPFNEAKSIKSMIWRQRSKDLGLICSAKGSQTGRGGRIAHFFVAISCSKCLVLCEQYFEKISGEVLADFIHKHCEEAFEKKPRIQRTNSFFRMVIHHKTADRRIMPCTKCVPKNSVHQHSVPT